MMIRALFAAALLLMLAACSADEGKDDERSAREEKQQEIATEIVDRIRDPIDKAEALKQREEARRESIEEHTR